MNERSWTEKEWKDRKQKHADVKGKLATGPTERVELVKRIRNDVRERRNIGRSPDHWSK